VRECGQGPGLRQSEVGTNEEVGAMERDNQNPRLAERLRSGGMNRRTVLKGATAAGVGAAAVGPFFHRSTRAQEKVQIRLATWAGQEEAAELQQVIDPINQASTTFEIVSEPSPADYYVKLQTTIAGGTVADLVWLSQENIAGFAAGEALLDISDRLAEDQSPAAKLDDYFPGILQTAQYDGRTYGLPWISQPVMLYYNPALFDEAGIAYPDESWTWDTFKEAAAALTDPAAGVYGTAFNDWPPIQMFIWQAGGEVISEICRPARSTRPRRSRGRSSTRTSSSTSSTRPPRRRSPSRVLRRWPRPARWRCSSAAPPMTSTTPTRRTRRMPS
jgi:hypothetical protein